MRDEHPGLRIDQDRAKALAHGPAMQGVLYSKNLDLRAG
jgi:hypothetical protein